MYQINNRNNCTIYLILNIIIFLNLFCSNNKNSLVEERVTQNNQITKYTVGDTIISSDSIFNNEFLDKPTRILKLHKSDDFIVGDAGNKCIYIFSDNGKYKGKLGRKGQGPGEFLGLGIFDIDKDDNIFISDIVNRRMTIMSSKGDVLGMFYINFEPDTRFIVTQRGEILVNLPKNNYYFTLYSKDGNILRNIGLINRYNKNIWDVNVKFAKGYPFQDEFGAFYIFLYNMPIVKKYNINGQFISEYNIIKEFPIYERYMSLYIPPEKYVSEKSTHVYFYNDIKYRNGYFYVGYSRNSKVADNNPGDAFLYEFNLGLQLHRILSLSVKINESENYKSIGPFEFEFLKEDTEILINISNIGSIIKFIPNTKQN